MRPCPTLQDPPNHERISHVSSLRLSSHSSSIGSSRRPACGCGSWGCVFSPRRPRRATLSGGTVRWQGGTPSSDSEKESHAEVSSTRLLMKSHSCFDTLLTLSRDCLSSCMSHNSSALNSCNFFSERSSGNLLRKATWTLYHRGLSRTDLAS